MTTNTTNSQAASIVDDQEFRDSLARLLKSPHDQDPYQKLVAHIDAKLAQVRSEGVNAANDFRALVSDSDTAAIKELKARARAAESRLAEIQRGIKALKTQRRRARILGTNVMDEEYFFYVGDVLALLQPQGQAIDTSGLPG